MYAHVIHCNDRKPCLRPSRPQHHAGFQPPSWLWVCWGLEAQLTVTKPMTKTRAQTLSQAVAVGGVSVRILPWRLFDFSSQFWHKPSAMRSPSTSPVSQADLQTAEHPHRLSSPSHAPLLTAQHTDSRHQPSQLPVLRRMVATMPLASAQTDCHAWGPSRVRSMREGVPLTTPRSRSGRRPGWWCKVGRVGLTQHPAPWSLSGCLPAGIE